MTGTIHIFSIEAEYTTARYLERAISSVVTDAPNYWTTFSNWGRLDPKDVFCFVDPAPNWPLGLECVPCLTVAYLIDVHQDLQFRLLLSEFFDVIFITQKEYVPLFREIGHKHVHWLPLACAPDVHCMPAVDRPYDLGFVGKLGQRGTVRHKTLTTVLPRYRTNDYTQFYAPRDMARVYGQSKIVFNASIKGDLNMRVFEALASGALLVTDRIGNGLEDLFDEDMHYVGYSSIDEASRKIDYYLTHPVERERIALEGQRTALQSHTYRHRWEELLQKAIGAYGQAPARRYGRTALGKLYSEIFVALRKPGAIAEVVRRYGPSSAVARNFVRAWARWVNARVPLTPNAISARLQGR